MSPPAANSESTPPAQKPSDHGYEVENMEAIRHDFLLRPKVIHRATIDWKQTRLLQYEGLHAVILDNALTAYECEMLIKQAETTTGGVWEQAMVNVGGGRQQFVPDTRDCGRIIWDDRDMVARIWDRVKDYVPEIHTLVGVPRVTGKGPAKRKEIWKMSRCNERMRFLKYGEGQYFKPHMDGCFVTPDETERSYYTLHLYLNEGVQGGATSFHSWDMEHQLDVEPKIGRVLIFQQAELLHSGADVIGGLKYTLRTDLMYEKLDVDEYE